MLLLYLSKKKSSNVVGVMFLLYYLSESTFIYLDQVNTREQAFERLCYRENIPSNGTDWESSLRNSVRSTRYQICDTKWLFHFVV